MKDRSLLIRGTAVLLVALLAAPSLLLAAVQPQLPNPGTVAGVTKQQQEQIGLQAMNEVYKQMPVLPDSNPAAQYIQQLGKRLQRVIPQQYSWPYQFHVVQESDINAFALPGGPIFVNIGTITAASNEAELAGVMAHEMSHVYMQHSMKAAKKEALPSALVGLLGGLLGAYGGAAGNLARLGIQIGAGAVMMKYSRADEAQADAVGAIIMYKAGYNPMAMADFFKKLEQQGGSGPQFLSDHPNPGNREAAIQKEIRDWPPEKWITDTTQFQNARNAARSVKAYSAQEIQARAKAGGWNSPAPNGQPVPTSASPGPGQTSTGQPGDLSGIMPTGGFRTLQHQAFTMQYPSNWQVSGDQTSAVTIAPQGGIIGQNAVAYGVLVNGYQPQNPSESLSQATQELFAGLRQQNPDLRMVGSPQKININGVQGESVDMMGTSPITQGSSALQEHDWLVTLPMQGGSLLSVVFVSPERDFNRLRPAFEQMLRSIRLQ